MIVWIVVAALLGPIPAALAQPLELRTPSKPDPAPGAPRSPDRDLGPQPAVPLPPPAYMRSLSDETRSRRLGAAAWTTSNPPVGSRGASSPESGGSAGFGFAVEWF